MKNIYIKITFAVFFLLLGITIANFFDIKEDLQTSLGKETDYVLFSLAAFVFSTLLDGYGASGYMLLFGIKITNLILEKPISGMLFTLGVLISSYAGIVFAEIVKKDFEEKANIEKNITDFLVPLVIGVAVSFIGALA